jgi:acyl transferase domain-containing protein
MDEPAGRLRQALEGKLRGHVPGGPVLFSTVTGARLDDPLDAAYWASNLRSPVRLADAVQALAEDGVTHVVEIGPHPVLAPALAGCLGGTGIRLVAAPRRDDPLRHDLLDLVARLYEGGVPLSVVPSSRARRTADLVPYSPVEAIPVRTLGLAAGAGAEAGRVRTRAPGRGSCGGEAADKPPGWLATALAADPEPGGRERAVRAALLALIGEALPAQARAAAEPACLTDLPFADLGLDSLAIVQVRNRLERALGRQVSVSTFYAHPTVDRLAAALARPQPAGGRPPETDPGQVDDLLADLEHALGPGAAP